MRFLMKVEWPTEAANKAIADPKFGEKMQTLLKDIKAEAAYFTTLKGQRGGYVIVNMDDVSQMPAIAEPFFLWLNAQITFLPVMLPEDLAKAGSAIATSVQKWGS